MVHKVVNNCQKFNRTICQSFDTILKTISQQAETADECVDAIKYVASVNEIEIHKLKVILYHDLGESVTSSVRKISTKFSILLLNI